MSYKSSNFRRGQNSVSVPADKANPKVQQLQEMFPSWSDDDLKSLLLEVNNDLEVAVIRISEGHAEHWGSVTRKKEKRPTAGATSTKDLHGGGDRERTDFRGARGARGGGRGGRGGGRGSGRGGHRETNGRHAPSLAPQAESHATGAWAQDASVTGDAASSNWGTTNGSTSENWGDAGGTDASASAPAAGSTSTLNQGNGDTTPGVWSTGAAAMTPEPRSQASTPVSAPPPVAKPVSKTPATSKMSWAQIAKPQEKPKVVPAPAPPPPVSAPAPSPEHVAAPPEHEPQVEPEAQGWEEPTTVQPPTWDDEPQPQATLPAASDGWITSTADIIEPQQESAVKEETSSPAQPEPTFEAVSEPSAFPAQLGLHQKTDSPVVPPAKSATPVSYARSLNSRAGGRFKTTDQAVVMPSAFGSSLEKLGMQFGSVKLGADDVTEANAPESAASETPAAASAPMQEVQPDSPALTPESPAPVPILSTSQTPITTHSLFQQTLPQQTQQGQPQIHSSLQTAQQAPPSLLPSQTPVQSSVSSQTATSTANSTPLTSFSNQQATPSSQSSISPYQHSSQHTQPQTQTPQTQAPAQNQIQPQSQLHQQFSHFPSHLDPTSNQQSPPQTQQQSTIHQGIGSHGSYFRQPDQSYFQTPTPPVGQAQDAPYGAFAPLSQQLGHQGQGSHLSGFSSDHFGYNDASRGFYESYGQQSSFGRNALGHDDISKTLPGAQQPSQSSSVLPQSASQTGQQQTTQQPQSAAQPQAPTAGQPQQGYAPVPYYYNPYHQPGQFYGPPYGSGYGLGQYANRYQPQQPPMFQPPNQTSASPANAKGPTSVQPQTNPYAQGLYAQQHASSPYDDGYSHQLGHQHNQSVAALPSNDYSKQLYGAQGIQSFMGVGQSAGPNATLAQRGAAGGGSPENTYKPYGPGVGAKDVGGAPGVGGAIAGGQASRASVQQPQHSQGFYGANRFSTSAGGPPNQQAQQQQNQAYPQGGGDSSFYYQRGPSQQPPYWQ